MRFLLINEIRFGGADLQRPEFKFADSSMPIEHYENFPVASLLLPPRLRRPVEAIYAFARSADDLADEGCASADERLAALTNYEIELQKIRDQQPSDMQIFQALASVVESYRLPLQPFSDLLSAFKQDVVTHRYSSFAALLDYCSRSANPVGRLMLHLYGADEPRNMRDADAICSALQLINFWQDVAVDWGKGRIYIPLEDMAEFGVEETQLQSAEVNEAWRALMKFETVRARKMMLSGAPLALRLPGRIGWELRLMVQGGLRILERIETADYDVFRNRPTLEKSDWVRMGLRAVGMRNS